VLVLLIVATTVVINVNFWFGSLNSFGNSEQIFFIIYFIVLLACFSRILFTYYFLFLLFCHFLSAPQRTRVLARRKNLRLLFLNLNVAITW